MGCATSKQAQQDHSRSPSPLPHDHHVVSFTSSTLHAINLTSNVEIEPEIEIKTIDASSKSAPTKNPKWILCTPTMTPPNEPETINTWELMAGLDHSLLSRPMTPPPPVERCSFSFQSVPITDIVEFDQEVLSAFRKAMEELSPVHPTLLRSSPKIEKMERTCSGGMEMLGQITRSCERNVNNNNNVLVYFTSLRGVRKTFEECCMVRSILKGYGVWLDERDLSMHRGFLNELQKLLGDGTKWQLPRVFVKGKHIGVEEVKRMHETGELASMLEGCEKVSDERNRPCSQCGDVRFVVCETCSGSCKLCIEEIGEELGGEMEDQEEERKEFMRCPNCNENGIVRCNVCCQI